MKHRFACQCLCTIGILLSFAVAAATSAQTTTFTYQGKLADSGLPANGNYDLQFALWDSLSGGAQIGATLQLNSTSVNAGVFTVPLDFGVNSFPGADRFLEIGVRPSGVGNFTVLSPRQQISSTPYAMRTLTSTSADTATNANQLGGVAASQYVVTSDSRLSDARAPTAGSSNYIQNTTSLQTAANFNISGKGSASGGLRAVDSGSGYPIPPGGKGIEIGMNGDGFISALDRTASTTKRLDITGNPLNFNVSGQGNVGIGTSSPTTRLHIFSSSNPALNIEASDSSFAETQYATGSYVWRTGVGGASVVNGAANKYYIFDINAGQFRMAIDTAGNVGIGTTGPAVKLQVTGDIRVGASGTNGCLQRFDGTALAGSCASDVRFKRNITPFPRLLDKVVKLQPVNYYWRSSEFPEKHFGNTQSYGLVAQEVERVLPELVGEDERGYKTVNYSELPLMMLQAIKELKNENDSLRQQNATMDARLKQLEQLNSDVRQAAAGATLGRNSSGSALTQQQEQTLEKEELQIDRLQKQLRRLQVSIHRARYRTRTVNTTKLIR